MIILIQIVTFNSCYFSTILGSRSRKQVFVTAKSAVGTPQQNKTPEITTNVEEERDILEEDLNDLNYVPYPKNPASSGRGRGRPSKGNASTGLKK